uniref:BHLH domain-containing protein n=1 Tax=Rhizophora mucronata TaxID=61149 RepID=A0A2P2KQ80_RHIMU
MVKATDHIWRGPSHCTWQSANLNFMSSSPEHLPQGCLPAPADMSPSTRLFSADVAIPGFTRVLNLKAQQSNEICALPPHHLLPHFQNLLHVASPCLNEKPSVFSSGLDMQAALNTTPQCQKGYIIFDRSGNGTRVLYSPFKSTIPRTAAAATKPPFGYDLQDGKGAAIMEPMNLARPTLHDVLDENHLIVEKTEMHEDTEEIDALLYSDEDGYDSYSDDDDEVASTGHSPVAIGLSYGTQNQVDGTTEEVASSDVQNKRQKLLDGGYKKSSLADTASSIRVERPHGRAECVGQTHEEEIASNLGNRELRKDKIRATLKILKSIVPDSKHTDPLLVLDEAIEYLKFLKLKAKSLGIGYC